MAFLSAFLKWLLNLLTPKAQQTKAQTKAPISKHLEGKRAARRCPEELRLLIESKLVEGGLPISYAKKDPEAMAIDIATAMELLKIREVGGNNYGHRVGMLQSVVGADVFTPGGDGIPREGDGQPWCMSAMQTIICLVEDYLGKESPIHASEHCLTVWREALKVPGLTSVKAEPGLIYIARYGSTSNGHTGLIKRVSGSTMTTSEGNTGDESIRDGAGYFQKRRNVLKNDELETVGFVRLYAKA